MDLSKALTQVKLDDKEEEIRVKQLLEMSAKKYNLQKELESLKLKLSLKRSEVKRLQKEVVLLSLEVPVLERQEEVAKRTVLDLTTEYVAKNTETIQIQENFWKKINNFVSDSNWFLANKESSMRDQADHRTRAGAGKERENKIRQLKVQSEIEAMHLYEKYQSTKMEELKLMKDLLGKDSFVI